MKISRNLLRKLINETINEIGYGGGYRDSQGEEMNPVEAGIYDVLTQHNLTGLRVGSENNRNKGPSTLFVISGDRTPLTDIEYVKKVGDHLKRAMPEYEIRTKPDQLNKGSAFIIQINKN